MRWLSNVPVLFVLGLSLGLVACGSSDTKLKVTGIEPDKGDAHGGTLVAIKGSRFVADGVRNAKVYFGSRPGTILRFANDSELRVQAPGGKVNETVDVLIVFEPGGELKLPNAFTFVEKGERLKVEDLDISRDKK